MEPNRRLAGKTAIVTGAARGIGRGIAGRLASEGANVVVASRTAATVEEAAAEIRAAGGEAIGVPTDVADRRQVAELVAATVAHFGQVDLLVNNAQSYGAIGEDAGFPRRCSLEDMAEHEASWDATYASGLKGSLYGMWEVFPHMRGRGGTIVNFGSRMGQLGTPGTAAYNCTKEAIRGLTRTAAQEWGPYGITVNCINPVAASTAVEASLTTRGIGGEGGITAALEAIGKRSPIGRMGSASDDVGGLVVYLATPDAAYLTGQTFMLDGGMTPFA